MRVQWGARLPGPGATCPGCAFGAPAPAPLGTCPHPGHLPCPIPPREPGGAEPEPCTASLQDADEEHPQLASPSQTPLSKRVGRSPSFGDGLWVNVLCNLGVVLGTLVLPGILGAGAGSRGPEGRSSPPSLHPHPITGCDL